jgi:hypothetical protein
VQEQEQQEQFKNLLGLWPWAADKTIGNVQYRTQEFTIFGKQYFYVQQLVSQFCKYNLARVSN